MLFDAPEKKGFEVSGRLALWSIGLRTGKMESGDVCIFIVGFIFVRGGCYFYHTCPSVRKFEDKCN